MKIAECFYDNDNNVGDAHARLAANKSRVQSGEGMIMDGWPKKLVLAAIAIASSKKLLNSRSSPSPGNKKEKQSANMSIVYKVARLLVTNLRSGSAMDKTR